MYMPLCRDCHNRESKLQGVQYIGDPTAINVKLETQKKSRAEEKFESYSLEKTISTDIDQEDFSVGVN